MGRGRGSVIFLLLSAFICGKKRRNNKKQNRNCGSNVEERMNEETAGTLNRYFVVSLLIQYPCMCRKLKMGPG
jgi:hypothetical protein